MSWKRWFLGTPLETERFQEERLRVPIALAVFSSDALSSVAYATEEILLVLSIAGVAALDYSMPISAVIALLLFIVIVSYRQTIHAYPEGGGSYIVARENLGTLLGLLFLFLLAVGNLRGVRQSGRIFAFPTYMFIFSMAALIVTGIVRAFLEYPAVEPPVAAVPEIQHALNLWLLMKAFSAGCAALTGIEAVSNGVQAFRKPEARNASLTLMIMAVILAFFFLGTSYLAHVYTVIPGARQTVVSQLGRAIFGQGLLYYLMQIATASILMVAANTAFADFPRLSSILARDRFVPRQLANLGDRLVYSNGILILAGSAGFLLILFGGNTHRLIPLYAVGVFLAFTLSQSGMVVRHLRLKGERYRLHAVINAVGATATGAALLVIATTKLVQGAWIVILLIPLFVGSFLRTHRHYFYVRQQLSLREIEQERPLRNTAIVPISAVTRATLSAVRYAKSIAHEVEAVHVAIDPARVDQVRQQWKAWGGGVPLRV